MLLTKEKRHQYNRQKCFEIDYLTEPFIQVSGMCFNFEATIEILFRIRKWGMRFQPVKCNMMQLTHKRSRYRLQCNYTLDGTVLENVESINYPGVTTINDLNWNTHSSYVCTKASRSLGFLRKFCILDPQMLKKQLIKDWCDRSWNMEAQFGTLILMASRKNWKRSEIVRQGL